MIGCAETLEDDVVTSLLGMKTTNEFTTQKKEEFVKKANAKYRELLRDFSCDKSFETVPKEAFVYHKGIAIPVTVFLIIVIILSIVLPLTLRKGDTKKSDSKSDSGPNSGPNPESNSDGDKASDSILIK